MTMNPLRLSLAALALCVAAFAVAPQVAAQTTQCTVQYGVVWTAGQWNACFASMQPLIGYTPVNKAGDALLGKLTTATPTTVSAPLNIPQGAAPTSPSNGDLWTTSAGMFGFFNGATIGPFIASGGSAVTSVFGRSGAVTAQTGDYSVGQVTGAAPTASPTFTGSFTATGLVTNADLANPSVTVSGTTCTLGSTCSPPVGTVTVGTTTISGGTSHGVLYNNGGNLGNLGSATNGQLVVGSTGANPVLATLTAGTGQTVTNGAGTITIAPTNPVTATAPSTCVINSTSATTCANGGSAANNGTYTTPAGALWLKVRMIGPGGSSSGAGTSPGNASAGSATTFGSSFLTANPGGPGVTSGATSSGGSSTGGDVNLTGAPGPGASGVTNATSLTGASSPFGGGAPGVPGGAATVGQSPSANTGAGASGATGTSGIFAGGDGAAGGYLEKIITSPSSTYSYAVGTAGTAGTAGTNGGAGALGGSGAIVVEAHFNY